MLYFNRLFFLSLFLVVLVASDGLAEQKSFELHGIYLEGCTCKMVCPCDLLGGMVEGCHAMGVMDIASGSYDGARLTNVKVAAAVGDHWVRLYVQAPDPEQRKAAAEMARAMFNQLGTIESVRDAKIELTGDNGSYALKVDDGKLMELHTEPILGADGKTAITYVNYPDPLFHTIRQGKSVSGNYTDGKRHFTLKETNSFFNQDWSASGNL
jgi:hypothetical protein